MKTAFDGRCLITVAIDGGKTVYDGFRFDKIGKDTYNILLTSVASFVSQDGDEEIWALDENCDVYELDTEETKAVALATKEVCKEPEKIITLVFEDMVMIVEYNG